jgi:hypothetical protein
MLTFLAVLALGAVICLPGMAAADQIILTFDESNLNFNMPPYNLFIWGGGWTISDGAVSAGTGATIASNNAFAFEGADFWSNAATNLTITGTQVGGTTVSQILEINSSHKFFGGAAFTGFTNLTKLTFGTDNALNFGMDNFTDSTVVPLPGALVLLGAGLVRLAAYSRRKRAMA